MMVTVGSRSPRSVPGPAGRRGRGFGPSARPHHRRAGPGRRAAGRDLPAAPQVNLNGTRRVPSRAGFRVGVSGSANLKTVTRSRSSGRGQQLKIMTLCRRGAGCTQGVCGMFAGGVRRERGVCGVSGGECAGCVPVRGVRCVCAVVCMWAANRRLRRCRRLPGPNEGAVGGPRTELDIGADRRSST
jgi:hypothetical protein